ncbi:rhodanese-like domain-containing protein [Flavobacterium sp.]|uniref:rhodanese-like domain-containing protein n=1 Tax=Flavobacterium sp. TaxID=239 RepID=UPI001B497A05|nr:rhodanese-like domain-containing protein [Flavobacterium sp.]MBP6183280.1 rhodanese-like domain-containing protein [Flavobacterium sp.]
MDIEKIIAANLGTIVDVRTYGEFQGGNVVGSINIPLNEIPERIEEIKRLKAPLILCCASGGRSGQAHHFLSQYGIECYNGGSWLNVNYYKSISK